jgi:signal transduction histidine kinase
MWVLAFVLVKVIELRERVHAREHAMKEQLHAIALHETQMQTLRDVIITLRHEINNPLAIVLGYVHLMKKSSSPDDALKHVNDIEAAALRIQSALKEFADITSYDTADSPAGKYVKRTTQSASPSRAE